VLGVQVTSMLDYGYWILTPNTLMTGGTYSVTLNEQGHTNGNINPLSYCVLKRTGTGASWQSLGTHNTNTQSQSNGVVTAVRSAYTSFSHFGIGKSGGATLPIKLISFTAKFEEGIVNLDWATAAEINNSFFTIERSQDGAHFEHLLTQPGAGNSTVNKYYTAIDQRPLTGFSYYRLKQTDYDGHYSYSDVQTVKNGSGDMQESDMALNIKSIYPNPFITSFKLNFVIKTSTLVDFSLMNTSGQVVAQSKIEAEEGYNTYEFLDNKNLKKGIYFAVLSFNNQKQIQKIVKN